MATTTFSDISLKEYGLTDRVAGLKQAYFRALPEICTERAALVTAGSQAQGLFGQGRISGLDKAKLYRSVLEKRRPVVRHTSAVTSSMERFGLRDRSLFAGSTTGKFKGVPLYPELMALALWPELETIKARKANPYSISDDEVRVLNEEVFPAWLDCNINELGRARLAAERARAGLSGDATEYKLLERLVFFLASKPNCISHTIPDFSRAIATGLRAVIAEAEQREKAAKDPESRDFFASIGQAMQGIVAYSRNLAAEARRLADLEKDATEKRELLALAAIHEQVPELPARSFREALTTVWMCWVAIHLENPNVGLSLGRLDQVLYPLYQQDIARGALDVGQAIELLCCLWLKIGDHVPMVPSAGEQLFGGSGSNQAITVGGVDAQGQDAVNDLTYVMLRATELMRLRDPNLNARYCSGVNSRAYLRRLCEVNLTTGATPALHNDKAVIAALTAKGETIEQARDYGVIGCVEPGSNGRSYGHSGAILTNLISALELAMFNGEHRHTGLGQLISERTGDVTTFQSFDELKQAFARQAAWLVDQTTSLNNTFGRVHQDFYPTPILSTLFEGPMEKGRDLIFGGAVINSSGATIIGFADVIDSLAAIEQVVFTDKSVTFAGLLAALQADFQGYEALLARLRNQDKTPKYGNENPKADAIALWLAQLLDELYGKKENYRGGRYRVGYWTMTNHAGFGRLSKSSPNGRRAGENFTSGITPVSGVTPYLTKALNSVASLPSRLLSNGVALNIKYTPEPGNGAQMLDNFVASVEAYFDAVPGKRDGGMEIQFNVTQRATFEDAVANPQSYPELLVRVSGYTAYFKDLNPQMQKEIIERTEYNLTTGHAVQLSVGGVTAPTSAGST
jgi:pyruvate formate-lyase/glycerol dehydratase family glycyl radical enzyme